jgi:hypothetical protein
VIFLSKTYAQESLLDTQEQVEQGHQDISEAQAEAAQAQKHVKKLERQVENLQAALKTEKMRNVEASTTEKATSQSQSKPLKKVSLTSPFGMKPSVDWVSQLRSRVPPAIQEEPEGSENEIEELPSKPRSRSQKLETMRGDKTKGRGKIKEMETAADESAAERPKGRDNGTQHEKENKDENMQLEDGEFEEDELEEDELVEEDIVETEVQEVRPPTKSHDRHQTQYSDIEEVLSPVKKPHSKKPPSNIGKSKESNAEDENPPKKRARSKPPSTTNGQKQSEVDTEEDQPAKKKKRKLNITSSSSVFGGPAGFTWNQVRSTLLAFFLANC